MRILISGAGIAGPTLAYWLLRHGFTPTLVECASHLRSAGYLIDFWGAGFEVASRMHLLPEIRRAGYAIEEVRVVDERGHKVCGFRADAVATALRSGLVSLPRGDLAAAIHGTISDRAETLFGDSIHDLEQTDRAVTVRFQRHGTRTFDLVIGADGLHSRVRWLAFGPESRFERYLGMKVAAFTTVGYRPRDELVYVMYSEVGQQVSRFAMRNDRTLFLFIFRDQDPLIPETADDQKTVLRARFGDRGWECTRILHALDAADDLYFDRVSQVELNTESWSRGRVTLVGDAASCVSLLGGQGAALAMTAAYVLAGELRRAGGEHRRAFDEYERVFRPLVRRKQMAARRFAGTFAPQSATALWLRNQVFRLLSIPLVAKMTAGRDFRDRIELREYEERSTV